MSTETGRYLYHISIAEFLQQDPNAIFGYLCQGVGGDITSGARDALLGEIDILRRALAPWADEAADIIMEYKIPRMGKRIDVVLLLRGIVFCLEFKVGQSSMLQGDIEQVMDYALNLKYFHTLSHDRTIVPILIPSNFKDSSKHPQICVYHDQVYNPLVSDGEHLGTLIAKVLEHAHATLPDNIPDWPKSPYQPTPTIVEAARVLYESHSVKEITRTGAESTEPCTHCVQRIIQETKDKGQKSICFVTGVPGAGKTLVGLDVAVQQSRAKGDDSKTEDGAVYLSGNGPLVAVLTEALARDSHRRYKEAGKARTMSECQREVHKFIQIIHQYRDNMLYKIKNPVVDGKLEIDPERTMALKDAGYAEVEHVAIFDEAQRAWTHQRIASYLKRGGTYGNKYKVPNFPVSEAAFLIWSMDQREDWATIVCLVGGGQEINTGEAGISEWLAAIRDQFTDWHVYISDKLVEAEYADGKVNDILKQIRNVNLRPELHLGVSMRSFRAARLSSFVHSLLDINSDAPDILREVLANKYHIVLTRSMDTARQWLLSQARGTEQTGVLVSKSAARFKPLAVHILPPGDTDTVHWFLADKNDVRSSNYLEDAATEIQVQGLELDYACLLWDADMQFSPDGWKYFKFNGRTRWRPENNSENQHYMLNAYRVLLTRARQGMVICVPEGNPDDPTRHPSLYKPTFEYLRSLGIPVVE